MNRNMKRTLKIISNMLLLLVLILAFLLGGLQFFGLKPYCVLSGSMKSVYPTGSLIYVKRVETDTLKKGDIITFRLDGNVLVTHRIVDILSDETDANRVLYRTKGDTNKTADGRLVRSEEVIGTPVFGIPYLGYLAMYISKPSGKYVVMLFFIAIMSFEFIVNVLLNENKKKEERRGKRLE